MRTFITLMVAVACVGVNIATAQATDNTDNQKPASAAVAPLPIPTLPANLDPKLVAWVQNCFKQANERRQSGHDVLPIFRSANRQVVNLPSKNAPYTCHVDGGN